MSNLSQFAAGGDPQYWVSGTTYALGKTVRSPIDHQRYVRVVAGAGTTDPANDATNCCQTVGERLSRFSAAK